MISRRSVAIGACFAVTGVLAVRQWRAATTVPRIYTGPVAGVAVSGYDTVAYFVEGAPRKGHRDISLRHDGAEWWFAEARHRAMFAATPERYAPRYGGYCAYAVAGGGTAGASPEHWQIVEERLYLNASRRVHAKWQRDPHGYIAKAEASWPRLVRI